MYSSLINEGNQIIDEIEVSESISFTIEYNDGQKEEGEI
jgi:hypothetical protein